MIEVTYLDHLGSDVTVTNAARVSFGKCTQALTKGDIRLLGFLARSGHWSPFSHPQISLHIKAPIFVARQLQKHQVGFAWNEISRRYVDAAPEFYDPGRWRARPTDKKQGSGPGVVCSPIVFIAFENAMVAAREAYEQMIAAGVAPEQARAVLPQATLTEWHWTGSLAAWSRMCGLRLAPDAQAETALVASQCANLIEPLFPHSWAALNGASAPISEGPAA